MRVAGGHARRLARQLDLGPDHRDDLRQQLLVDLLERLDAFDGTSPFTAFARLVMRHQAATLAQRCVRELRRPLVPMDAVRDDEHPDALDRLIADGDGSGTRASPKELRADLDRVLGRLPAELQRICSDLAENTTAEAATCYGASRATFYRRLGDLRLELLTYDLRPAA